MTDHEKKVQDLVIEFPPSFAGWFNARSCGVCISFRQRGTSLHDMTREDNAAPMRCTNPTIVFPNNVQFLRTLSEALGIVADDLEADNLTRGIEEEKVRVYAW